MTNQATGPRALTPEDIDIVNGLFRQLKSCFTAWAVHLKTPKHQDEAKRQWTKSFVENGINTPELIEIGMVMARRQPTDFFPSPGKFVEWCKPTPVVEHWEHRTQEVLAEEELLALPVLKAEKKFGVDHSKKMREDLNI